MNRFPARPLALAIHLTTHMAVSAALPVTLAFAPLAAHADSQHAFQVPAGPLAASLTQIAEQAGVLLSFEPAQVQGRSAPAIEGSMTLQRALEQALDGSGLEAISGSGGYRLRTPSPNEVQLRSVQVRGNADATTEHTGSYTTRSTRAGNKLDLSLRETPQSVTVLTRQRLDDLGVTGLKEVMNYVTGVYATNNDTERTSIYSRGYSITNYQVDGVPVVQGDGYVSLNNDTAIYDRVDIVRGATGLMTGNGDPSGYISLTRKMPTPEFQGHVSAGVGRWSYRRLEADVGGPLALDGRLRGRAVVAKQESESFRDRYEQDKEVFYGVLQFDLTEGTILTAGYDRQEPDATGVTWGTVPYWMADGSKANMGRSTNYAPKWGSWPIEQEQWFASVEHFFNENWRFKVTYTDDTKEGDGKVWYGGSGYPRADGGGMSAWTMHSIFEIQTEAVDAVLNGKFPLFGREHEIVLGISDSKSTNETPYTVLDPMPASYSTIPDWRTWNGDIAKFGSTVYGFNSYEYETQQRGIYAAARFSITDPLTLIVGARLSDWEYETRQYNTDSTFRSRSGYEVKDELTPYVGVVFDINAYLSAYASYTDIFKAQNYRDMNNNFIDPIVGTNTELGLKGEFFDKRLNTALAVFSGKQDNIAEVDDSANLPAGSFDPSAPPPGYNQNGQFLLPDGATPYKSSGKGNKVKGFEVEVQGQVTDKWNLTGGYTFTHVENAAGDRIQTDRPKRLLRLFSTYKLDELVRGLEVGGGVTWQSDIWRNAQRPTGRFNGSGAPITAAAPIGQGSFLLANAMVRYRITDNLSTSLNVDNLFDKAYYRNVGFYNGVHWGDPRSWTMRVRYDF